MTSRAGESPFVEKGLSAENKQTEANARCFFQLGHDNGSFGSDDGAGTRTRSVPFLCFCLLIAIPRHQHQRKSTKFIRAANHTVN